MQGLTICPAAVAQATVCNLNHATDIQLLERFTNADICCHGSVQEPMSSNARAATAAGCCQILNIGAANHTQPTTTGTNRQELLSIHTTHMDASQHHRTQQQNVTAARP